MNFKELVNIVEKLRAPGGCPWDREQTRETLKPFLVEEFYEVIDAIEEDNSSGMKEELGDLLFQIVLQSQLSKEEGIFDINDVITGISEKMVRRHPHVFDNTHLESSDDVAERWEEHKKKEGKNHRSILDGVPRALPALLRAREIQLKATKVGFDWKRIEDVFNKLDEEIREFKSALEKKKYTDAEEEIGDIFFVLVRIANFVNINPEDALRKTIKKFDSRFRHIEKEACSQGKKLSEMTLEEMELLWNAAKQAHK
jgi:tetrapyrrole methylase family protein/MazG family protein